MPLICPFLKEPIQFGHEMPLLCGVTCDVHALAQYIKKTGNAEIDRWINGVSSHRSIQDFSTRAWINDAIASNLPIDGKTIYLTGIERRALTGQIMRLNALAYYETNAYDKILQNALHTQSTFDTLPLKSHDTPSQHHIIMQLWTNIESFERSDEVYWVLTQLAAYTICLLAPSLITLSSIQMNGGRSSPISIVYALTRELMTHCLVFNDRNRALYSLFMQLDPSMHLSYVDLIASFQSYVLSPTQLSRFHSKEKNSTEVMGELSCANTCLLRELRHFIQQNPSTHVRQGRFTPTGFLDTNTEERHASPVKQSQPRK
jgi:hypothetical protein